MRTMTVKVENHFSETVEPYILEQYKDSARWKSCLAAVIRRLDDCEKYVWDFSRLFDYNDSSFTGDRIDFVGIFFNIPRNAGENDEKYRSRLVQSITSKDSGTAENVKRNARFLSGDEDPTVLDEAPGVFFVYTPNGQQIKREKVQRLAPAGVIGLPGAAIKMGDGSLLGDSMKNVILVEADDEAVMEK